MVNNKKIQHKVINFLRSKIPGFSLAAYYLLHATSANAQYGFTDYLGSSPGGAYTITWFFNVLRSLTCYLIQFAIIAFGVMIIVYGLMYFKGMGSPQGMTSARKALTWGLVGGFVIFSVFTIVLSVASILGADFRVLDMVKCS
jgi:hypothetical protein